jgi:hypothetical protein
VPAASISARQPGSTTVALCASKIKAGPSKRAPGGRRARSCAGASIHPSSNQAREVVAPVAAAGAPSSIIAPRCSLILEPGAGSPVPPDPSSSAAREEATTRIDSSSTARPSGRWPNRAA